MRLTLLRLLLPSARSLRVSAYCLGVFALLSLLSERLLHARVGEAALRLGSELAGLAELTPGAESLLINGARFEHSLTVVEGAGSAVLDRIERECDNGPGPLPTAIAELVRKAGAALDRYEMPAASRRGVLRYERDGRGVLVCFSRGAEAPARSLAEQLDEFSKSSDLSVFGNVRYALTEPSDAGHTRLMLMWTNDALNLRALFPEAGDSAGSDPKVLPRPPAFRRTLSAAAARMPFGVWLYEGSRPKHEVLAFYETWLAKRGFQRTATNAELGARSYLGADGLQTFLSVTEEEGHTSVALVEAGNGEQSPTAAIEITE